MAKPPRVALGDLRPLANVDPHLGVALAVVLKETGPAFMTRLEEQARRSLALLRRKELQTARAQALDLHHALCLAVVRYRTCRGTRAQAVDAIRAFYNHCAPKGSPVLDVGRELVANQLDADLLAELPRVRADAERFHAWLEANDDTSIAAKVAPLEYEFNGAIERLRQGEGKRSSVIEAATKLRERYATLMSMTVGAA